MQNVQVNRKFQNSTVSGSCVTHQQAMAANTSYVPGDVIKEKVELKPTFDLVTARLKKRYRGDDSIRDIYVKASLTEPTVEAAYKMALAALVRFDGHERNIILTPAELTEQRRKNNIKGIMSAVIETLKKSGKHTEIVAAVNRQIAMRKLKFNPGYIAEHVIRKLKDNRSIGIKSQTTVDTIWNIIDIKAFDPVNHESLLAGFDLS